MSDENKKMFGTAIMAAGIVLIADGLRLFITKKRK